MKKILAVSLMLFLMLPSLLSKDLTGVVGLALPPYNMAESNNGIELDIVRRALELGGHNLKVKFVPFKRARVMMDGGKGDLLFTTNESSNMKDVFYSESHITYQNMAISLKKNNYIINKIDDLKKRKIVAFQDATIYLGAKFKSMAEQNANYKETARQESQIALLFAGRTEVLVADINIFKYFKNKTKKIDTNQDVSLHEIFPKTIYKIAFRDKQIRDDFNKGLKKLKKSGEYQKIFNKYTK